jgi:hypothetical protein
LRRSSSRFACDARTKYAELMKIATFNINNINKRLDNLVEWLRAEKPNVACLQELKATDAEFPIDAIQREGYHAAWRGQRSWNGIVADLIRDTFKRGKYQDVILPLTVLRRLDCVLAPTKEKVLKRQAELRGKGLQDLDAQLRRASGFACSNWHPRIDFFNRTASSRHRN